MLPPRFSLFSTCLLALCGCAASAHSVADHPPSAASSAASAEAAVLPLSIEVYNPGADGIFQVASVLVSGQRDAILVDAQFSSHDAARLVERVKRSGKRLTTIYISGGDPDFYFGLDTLTQAFPEARVVAPAVIVEHIQQTREAKQAFWGPKLGDGAPARVVVPDVLRGDHLMLEGRMLQVVGLDGPTPERSFVWVPSIGTVLGGIPVIAGEHVWMADTQTAQSRAYWLETLRKIESLRPRRVIPGHFFPGAPQDLHAVRFTADYIRTFEEQAAQAADADALIAAMKQRYPTLAGESSSLVTSARVAKGEMAWP